MTFRAVVPGRSILGRGGLFSFFFRKVKRVPVFALMAGLWPALLVPNAVAQTTTNTPIFQFAVFYNLDMDFSPGQPITLNGKVHVDGTLWMCPQATATFNDTVEATLMVTNADNPNDQQNMTFSSSYVHYNGGLPVSGVVPFILLPYSLNLNNNPEAILNLPPVALGAPNAAAYYPSNQIYLYNECDLIISNSVTGTNGALGTNLTIYYQDKDWSGGPLIQLTNNEVCRFSNTVSHLLTNGPISLASSTNKIIASYFPFVTNVAFYDYREGKTVQAVQIDIAKLSTWLTNPALEGSNWNRVCGGLNGMGLNPAEDTGNKGHPIDSIYVYNSVPITGTRLPAVRVINGGQLPTRWGLTIATPQPLYVLGNYNIQTNASGSTSVLTTNTAWTWPAALMGDAVTILSSSWSDAYTSGTSYTSRNAVTTTVNAACLGGIVPSTKVGSTKHYSGGLENFPRLLENWSGDTLCYNGSIAALFPSIYATNYWIGPGTYYDRPTRQWSFDANFLTPVLQPPLTPQIGHFNFLAINAQPQSQTVPVGSTATFTVSVSGPFMALVSYQWRFNGTNLAGATNLSLTLTNVQLSQAGNYAVLASNMFGLVLSSNAALTVIAMPPSISAQPTNQTVLLNGTAIFGVTATGSLPLSYQWSFNGTNLIGSTNDLLMLFKVQTNQAGDYAVQVSNTFGSTNSANALLTVVGQPPAIQTQPTNQAVFVYSNATFSITASGSSPFSCQWSFNGTDIDGATNIVLTLTNVQPAQAGDYAVQVTNPFGSTNSANATLVVVAQPTILVQPVNQTLMAGNMAFFSVTAVGFSPLNYQWQFNRTNLVGNTNSLLTLAGVNTNNNGSYQVIVTNAYGSVTSSVATLTLTRSLVVVWGNQTNVPDGLANVTEIATRSGHNMALKANGTVAAWGGNTFGQTDVPADLTNVVAISAGISHSLALQSNGKVIGWGFNDSGQVNIPQNLTNVVAIAAGGFHSLALRADGTVAAWGEDYYGQTDVPGGLTNVVAIAACSFHGLALQANGTVVAWGHYGYGIDNVPAGLTNVVAIAGGNFHSLALRANGTVAAWGLNASGQTGVPLGLTNVVAIAAGANFSLALQANGTIVGWGYNVNGDTQAPAGLTNVIAIAAGDSHSMALENDGSPVILRQPASQTALTGTTIAFTAAVVGRSRLSYQWQKNGTNLTDGGNASGTTTAALTLANVQTNDAGTYTLVVTNDFGSATSSNGALTVLVPPSISTQPTNCTSVAGTSASFNVVAEGTAPLSYQWQWNGTNLVDATNSMLTLNGLTPDQAGSYSVIVANPAGSLTSSNAVLSVYASAAATLVLLAFSGDQGFQFQVTGVPGFNYAVQESTNLIDWLSLITNTAPFVFADTNTASFPQQFYRAIYEP